MTSAHVTYKNHHTGKNTTSYTGIQTQGQNLIALDVIRYVRRSVVRCFTTVSL